MLNLSSQIYFLRPVWLVVYNGNRNDIQCKILLKVPYHSYGNETLITKKIFIYKFPLPSNSTPPIVIHWNEFYEENEMLEVGQV